VPLPCFGCPSCVVRHCRLNLDCTLLGNVARSSSFFLSPIFCRAAQSAATKQGLGLVKQSRLPTSRAPLTAFGHVWSQSKWRWQGPQR
jgi:hypothetical protein